LHTKSRSINYYKNLFYDIFFLVVERVFRQPKGCGIVLPQPFQNVIQYFFKCFDVRRTVWGDTIKQDTLGTANFHFSVETG